MKSPAKPQSAPGLNPVEVHYEQSQAIGLCRTASGIAMGTPGAILRRPANRETVLFGWMPLHVRQQGLLCGLGILDPGSLHLGMREPLWLSVGLEKVFSVCVVLPAHNQIVNRIGNYKPTHPPV